MSESELQFLLDLHQTVSERLCEHLGHEWEDLPVDGTMNPLSYQRCQRCSATRSDSSQFNSTATTGNIDD